MAPSWSGLGMTPGLCQWFFTALLGASAGCLALDSHPGNDTTLLSPAPESPPGGGGEDSTHPAEVHHLDENRSAKAVVWDNHSQTRSPVEVARPEQPRSGGSGEANPALHPGQPPGPLTLDQAIQTTLFADPKLRAAFEAIQQANADLLTSSLKPNPEFMMDAQLLPLTREFTVQRQGGPPQMDVQVAYPIDWYVFGKRAAAMASAGLGTLSAEADYADRVRQRVTETAVAFFDVLEAQALLELARQDLESLGRVEAATRRAVEAGGRAAIELDRVRLAVLDSERTLRSQETAASAARARLRALLGRLDTIPVEVDGRLDVPGAAPPPPTEDLLKIAEENRPDIRSLRWQVDKAQADVEVEDRNAYPDLKPQLGYTRQFQTRSIGFPDANSWMVAVNTSLPLYNRNQGNRAKARSVLAQRSFELQSGLVDLRSELDQAVVEFRAAYQEAIRIGPRQRETALKVRDSIEKAFAAGGRTLLEVLDAQRAYRDTYRLSITGQANYWRSMYRLNSAVGKSILP